MLMFTISNHLPSLNIAENFCSLGSLHDLNPQTASELPLVHPIKKICSVTFISRIVCRALRLFFFWSLINNLKYLNNTILYSVQRTYELSQSSSWEYAWSEKFTVIIKMKFRLVINLGWYSKCNQQAAVRKLYDRTNLYQHLKLFRIHLSSMAS